MGGYRRAYQGVPNTITKYQICLDPSDTKSSAMRAGFKAIVCSQPKQYFKPQLHKSFQKVACQIDPLRAPKNARHVPLSRWEPAPLWAASSRPNFEPSSVLPSNKSMSTAVLDGNLIPTIVESLSHSLPSVHKHQSSCYWNGSCCAL